MSMPGMNGGPTPLPTADTVRHILTDRMEPATMLTGPHRSGELNLVSLVFSAPGKTISFYLLADDAITWGEQLVKAGRNSKSGLITP